MMSRRVRDRLLIEGFFFFFFLSAACTRSRLFHFRRLRGGDGGGKSFIPCGFKFLILKFFAWLCIVKVCMSYGAYNGRGSNIEEKKKPEDGDFISRDGTLFAISFVN